MRYQMRTGTLLTLADGKVSACFSRSFAASALLGQRLAPVEVDKDGERLWRACLSSHYSRNKP